MKQKLEILDGILFAFGEDGISKDQLAIALDSKLSDIDAILETYKDKLTQQDRGVEMHQFSDSVKLVTKSHLHETITDLLQFNKTKQLSQAALETLAIIAYKQPVTRLEIEDVRGVNSDMMCRRLEALDLIKEAGRADSIGKPFLYEVTDQFMDVFKLTSLKELPEIRLEMLEENNDFFK